MLVAALLCWRMVGLGASVPADDVLLKLELEEFVRLGGVKIVDHAGAAGGRAVELGDESTGLLGAVNLAPGQYTLLLRAFAPAGDRDAYFVQIGGERARWKARIGAWGTELGTFAVQQDGPLAIRIIGQEAGCLIDQIAIVRGALEAGSTAMEELPGERVDRVQVPPDELPRLSGPVALAELPAAPFEADDQTLRIEHFDTIPDGVSGEHRAAVGRFGGALYLAAPDGRYVLDTGGLRFGPRGTIEWWVRPRPGQRLWHDQGWHYFLHAAPAESGGFQLDLSRHPRTELRLSASRGGGPYDKGGEPRQHVRVATGSLDLEAWHHLLVSWDLTGERQSLWLLVDGRGEETVFERAYDPAVAFTRIELGNTPTAWDVPFLPIDGAIDELRIRSDSVADRLRP